MSEGNLRLIVEASMGKKSDEEWNFGMSVLNKVLEQNLKIGIIQTQYSLIRLARHLLKPPDRRCLN